MHARQHAAVLLQCRATGLGRNAAQCSLPHNPAYIVVMQDLQNPYSASGALVGGSCGCLAACRRDVASYYA
jgi:hypothetical protein